MDDLDKLALEVAIGILQTEADDPGSQPALSIKLAEEIIAHLHHSDPEHLKAHNASNGM